MAPTQDCMASVLTLSSLAPRFLLSHDRDMGSGVIMEKSSLCRIDAILVQILIDSLELLTVALNRLRWVAINRLAAFQYFVMHDSLLIPPNAQHDLFDEFVGFRGPLRHLV